MFRRPVICDRGEYLVVLPSARSGSPNLVPLLRVHGGWSQLNQLYIAHSPARTFFAASHLGWNGLEQHYNGKNHTCAETKTRSNQELVIYNRAGNGHSAITNPTWLLCWAHQEGWPELPAQTCMPRNSQSLQSALRSFTFGSSISIL
jgi:hypothetical protein